MLKLEALKRDTKEDLKNMREMGIVPAVFYGPKEESTPIKIESTKFEKIFKEAGESTIIDLSVEGDSHDVLVHAVDRDPVKEVITHVDFYVIERGKKIKVDIPLEFVGESKAEKDGDVLVKVMHEVEIESMPRHLPSKIEVDISVLEEVGDQILAKDLNIPEEVEIMVEEDEVIALIQAAKEEDFDEPVEGPDMESIEVEGSKPEGEGEDDESPSEESGQEEKSE